MKWNNLKNNKCPKCNKNIEPTHLNVETHSMIHPCGFKISTKRWNEIVHDKVNREIENHYRPEDENPDS